MFLSNWSALNHSFQHVPHKEWIFPEKGVCQKALFSINIVKNVSVLHMLLDFSPPHVNGPFCVHQAGFSGACRPAHYISLFTVFQWCALGNEVMEVKQSIFYVLVMAIKSLDKVFCWKCAHFSFQGLLF